jgi:hypothetical protein
VAPVPPRISRGEEAIADPRRISEAPPVIMGGGSGSRMWPESRETLSKQLIALIGAVDRCNRSSAWSAIRRSSSPILSISCPWIPCK